MPLRPMGREQMWMLPPTLDELLPLDHPARFVAEFVDALDREDWGELEVEIDGEALGAPAYHPRALLSVWLYGFMTGVRSCRKLEAACRDQIPYLWLTGWQRPDHNTLWRFYRGHRQAMRKLFERTVRTAVTMKLVDLAVQAVDGTKVVANASLNRSYDAEGLRGLLERLESAITDLEGQNEAGEDASAIHLPRELADKEVLREQVRQAMDDLTSQKRHKRINLTDPDARLMKGRQGIVAGYNAQAMVSPTEMDGGATGMLVTAVDVVDAANDNALLVPMMEQADFPAGVLRQSDFLEVGTEEGQLLPGTYRYQSTFYDYKTNSHIVTDDRVNERGCRLTLNYYGDRSRIELTYGEPFDFSFHTYHGNVNLGGVYPSDCGPNTGGLYRVGE